MEKVMAAVHIPENNVRQMIAAVLVLFFHMIIKHPVLVHAGINLHIRDNDQCFRHFLRRNIVIPCCFQNVFKCSLQVRIHSPANTLNTLDFLLQRFPLQGNKYLHSVPYPLRKICCTFHKHETFFCTGFARSKRIFAIRFATCS